MSDSALIVQGASIVSISIPNEEAPAEEIKLIEEELATGQIMVERAVYRIWRMRNNESYKKIVTEEDPNVLKYPSWESFVLDITKSIDRSRMFVYGRMKIYDILDWLGYSDVEKINMMFSSPELYKKIFDTMVDWNTRAGRPTSIYLTGETNIKEDEAKIKLKELVDESSLFERPRDAIKHLETDVLKKPEIDLYFDGSVIVCKYTRYTKDANDVVSIADYGEVTFYPNNAIPEWLSQIIKSRVN